MNPNLRLAPIIVMVAVPVLSHAASKPVYTAVYYSTNKTSELAGIAEGAPGFFYAMAGAGEIFSVTASGRATILASFSSPPYEVGSAPGSVAANGLLYSSVSQIGSGNIFSVGAAAGTMTIYASSSYAATPIAGSLPSGDLFGIAYNYSNNSNNLATVDPGGNVTPFYTFPSTDRYPGVPIYGSDGNYYGVAQPYTVGQTAYFYKVTPSGAATTVATLPFLMTAFLGGGLVLQGSDGNFYGVQSTGLGCPSNQHGGVYKLTPSGEYTLLHQFGTCGDGTVNSLIEGSDGKLYGAIQGNSEIFSLTKSGEYKALFSPSNGATQGLCQCRLIQGSDGKIYGAAEGGGPGGFGVVFSLDVGLPPPAPQALKFAPQSGRPGTRVRIWGNNLFGSSVEFRSASGMNVVASGPSYVWATVPEGAASGPITVTTPGGTSATPASFTVE